MTSIAVVENKISAVKKYLKLLLRYQQYSRQEIEENIDIRGAVERYLYLATQATIDLADAIIAQRSFRKPATLSDAFSILNEEGIIPLDLTGKLVQMTGFRNVMAHDYERVNYDIVYRVLHEGVKDIEQFLQMVQKIS